MLLVRNKRIRQLGAILETGNILGLKLLFKNPSAALTYPNLVFRDYMSLARTGKWESRKFEELFPVASTGKYRIVLQPMPGEGVDTPIDELAYLAFITRIMECRNIFEIGTFRGRTALNFALNSPEDCTVYTMDLPSNERSADHVNAADRKIIRQSITGIDYQGQDSAHKIKQLFGDSTKFDFSPYHGKMCLVFVDGAHHYPAVRNDTEAALRMVRPGGCIVWHDFANYGDYNDVIRGVLDVLGSDSVFQISNTQLAVYRSPGANGAH